MSLFTDREVTTQSAIQGLEFRIGETETEQTRIWDYGYLTPNDVEFLRLETQINDGEVRILIHPYEEIIEPDEDGERKQYNNLRNIDLVIQNYTGVTFIFAQPDDPFIYQKGSFSVTKARIERLKPKGTIVLIKTCSKNNPHPDSTYNNGLLPRKAISGVEKSPAWVSFTGLLTKIDARRLIFGGREYHLNPDLYKYWDSDDITALETASGCVPLAIRMLIGSEPSGTGRHNDYNPQVDSGEKSYREVLTSLKRLNASKRFRIFLDLNLIYPNDRPATRIY